MDAIKLAKRKTTDKSQATAEPEPNALQIDTTDSGSENRFREFIADVEFPCVGAKSAMARGGLEIHTAQDITTPCDDVRIHSELLEFAARYRSDPGPFKSLAVIYAAPTTLSEQAFEDALWARAQAMSHRDGRLGHMGDPRASSDPTDPHFALSFGGEAFFVVGLHPGASRPARRFSTPALVFNPHEQFERLREQGRYEGLRKSIIGRDVALAGDENPMLARFGEISEARQYSGRQVDDDWQCPFNPAAGGDTHRS